MADGKRRRKSCCIPCLEAFASEARWIAVCETRMRLKPVDAFLLVSFA